MADENEYVYRLSLDHRDVQAAINTILSAVGDLDDQFATKSPRAIRKTETALADLLGQMREVRGAAGTPTLDDRKLLAAERRQHSELAKLVAELRTAEKAYARFLEGRLTGRGGGKGLGEYTSADLDRLQSTADVVGARGSFTRDAAAMQRDQVAAVREQVREEDRVVAALEREEALERQIAAQVERTAQARHAAGTQQTADIERAERAAATENTVQNQRRLAGSTLGNLGGTGTANGRNSAAGRVGTQAQREAFGNEQQAALRAYYEAQEKAQAATAASNQAINEAYERQLPRLRYALYDVSTALGLTGAATVAAGGAVLKTAADYQSLYAGVRRTSDILTSPSLTGTQKESAFASLRGDLVELSTQIPVTFADITTIATLGNQLGIASSNISSFTKTVAQFSATTDVGVDEAATAFGRLGELLNDQDYRKIGDEIAYLGVKSVATESDIINTASQLAVSGQGIKLTTENVLALATSVASLGVKPEQARGTFIRTFGQIGAAVAAGGQQLNDVARIAGVTADEFRKQFSAGGDSAYRAFLQFTSGLGSSTADINANLASIGITAVRDRQTLGLLAQNGTRALDDLSNAAKGADNDFLNKAYGEQAATVTAKLQTLGNQVLALFDTIGSSTTGPIGFLLDRVQGLVGLLDDLAKVPVTQQMLGLGAVLAVLVGVLAVVAAGGLRVYGAFLALQQVMAEVGGTGGGLIGVLTAIGGRMGLLTEQTQALIAANHGLALSNEEVAVSGAASNASMAGAGASAARGVSGVSKLSGALGKAGLVGAILGLILVLPSVAEGIQGIVNDLKDATPGVDDLTRAVKGLSAAGADQAKKKLLDATQGFGTAPAQTYSNVNGKIVESGFVQGQAIPGRRISAGAGAVNRALTGQDALKGQLLQGADVDTAAKELANYDKTLSALLASGDQAGFNQLLAIYTQQMGKAGVSAARAQSALTLTREATGTTGNELITFKSAAEQATAATDDGTDSLNAFTDALNGIFDGSIAAQKVTDDLAALGTSAVENGAKVAFSGTQMKQAIADVYASSDDTSIIKGRLQSIYDGLVALGYAKPALVGLAQAIAQIPGPATKSDVSLDAFSTAVDKARDKSDAAAKSVRQLSDYASDLSQAFARANELRFGNQDATDTLVKGFRDLRSSISDSREELRKAKADLRDLNADQDVRKYQLGIATRFGDTLRANSLGAEIAKGEADIRAKRQDVRNAQTATSTAVTGNSDGAIANRQRLGALIQNGQDVLTQMAKNGASPKELEAAAARLKAQFIDQGQQMGFRKKDLENLSKAYDDYSRVISGIPKNLTTNVKANTSPAEKALAEYREKLKGIDGTTVTTKVVQQAISEVEATASVQAEANTAAAREKARVDAIRSKQRQIGFRSGGYTGSRPRWQSAGEVHGDEFVLNSQGYRLFPRQMLEAANHGVAPQSLRVNATASLTGSTVSLSKTDRALMAAGGGSQSVNVNADRFGSAMDAAFSRSSRRGEN